MNRPLIPDDNGTPSRDGKRRSGFEPDVRPRPCCHPGHQPPGHMVIPHGKVYRHICPACGFEVVLRPPNVSLCVA